jgi:hypothetical protein
METVFIDSGATQWTFDGEAVHCGPKEDSLLIQTETCQDPDNSRIPSTEVKSRPDN